MAGAYYRPPEKRKKDFTSFGATPIGVTVHGRTELLTISEAEQFVVRLQAVILQAKEEDT